MGTLRKFWGTFSNLCTDMWAGMPLSDPEMYTNIEGVRRKIINSGGNLKINPGWAIFFKQIPL